MTRTVLLLVALAVVVVCTSVTGVDAIAPRLRAALQPGRKAASDDYAHLEASTRVSAQVTWPDAAGDAYPLAPGTPPDEVARIFPPRPKELTPFKTIPVTGTSPSPKGGRAGPFDCVELAKKIAPLIKGEVMLGVMLVYRGGAPLPFAKNSPLPDRGLIARHELLWAVSGTEKGADATTNARISKAADKLVDDAVLKFNQKIENDPTFKASRGAHVDPAVNFVPMVYTQVTSALVVTQCQRVKDWAAAQPWTVQGSSKYTYVPPEGKYSAALKKTWNVPQPHGATPKPPVDEQANAPCECAGSKLAAAITAGGPRQLGMGDELVCMAEINRRGPRNPVKVKSFSTGLDVVYPHDAVTPSCATCQRVIPYLLTGF